MKNPLQSSLVSSRSDQNVMTASVVDRRDKDGPAGISYSQSQFPVSR